MDWLKTRWMIWLPILIVIAVLVTLGLLFPDKLPPFIYAHS